MTTLKRSRIKKKFDRTAKAKATASKPKPRKRNTPAASVALAAPTRGQIQAVQQLFDKIPEAELKAALESSDDDRAARLLSILGDPAYAQQGYAMKIRAAGLTVVETLKLITSMHRSDADLRVARRMPSIMERMAVEAEPHLVPCPKCSSGTREDIADAVAARLSGKPEICGRCGGQKMVMKAADNDVRKMILESQSLIGNRGPLIDARQVNMYAGAPDMTDWSRGSDNAFERDVPKRIVGSVIDAKESR